MGPGFLYVGAFGAAEPATVVTAPPVAWANVGGTLGGVSLNISQEYTELEVDQVVDIPGRRLTKRELTIETQLAEATLENMALALNQTAPTVATTEKTLDAANGASVFVPNYSALLFDGFGPNGKRRRFIARRCLAVDGTETAYSKDEQTVLSVKWSAHYVSAAIAPFKAVDDISA